MAAPQRGEVWLVDLGFVAKTQPALVLSIPAGDDERALAAIVPHTTACRFTRFEVPILLDFLKTGAFDTQQILTVSHAKFIRRLGRLTDEQLARIESGVCDWLGLHRN